MAVRTDDAAVRAIIDLDAAIVTTAFIEAASLMVDWVDVHCDTAGLLSDDHLLKLETWLAAHLASVRDQGYLRKKTGDAEATFQGQTGLNLQSTFWGQTALTLDVTGCLAQLNKQAEAGKRKLTGTWLGKPLSDQIDYVDRN